MIQPKVVLLIFVSGKIVLTGAKVRSEIYEAFNKIYNVLAGKLGSSSSASIPLTSSSHRIPQSLSRLPVHHALSFSFVNVRHGRPHHRVNTPASSSPSRSRQGFVTPAVIFIIDVRLQLSNHSISCRRVSSPSCYSGHRICMLYKVLLSSSFAVPRLEWP
jgi:hypothetical protein